MTRSHVSHAALLRRIDPGINRVLLCVTLDLSPPLRERRTAYEASKNRDQPHEYHLAPHTHLIFMPQRTTPHHPNPPAPLISTLGYPQTLAKARVLPKSLG